MISVTDKLVFALVFQAKVVVITDAAYELLSRESVGIRTTLY